MTSTELQKQAENLFFNRGIPTKLTTTLAGGLGGAGFGGLLDYMSSPANEVGYDGIVFGGLLGSTLGYKSKPLVNLLMGRHPFEEELVSQGQAEREAYRNRKPDFESSVSDVLPEGYESKARSAASKYRDEIKTHDGDLRNEFAQSLSPKDFKRKIRGFYEQGLKDTVGGYYLGGSESPSDNIMVANPNRMDEFKDTLSHELTHSMQEDYFKGKGLRPAPGGFVPTREYNESLKANDKFKDVIDRFSSGNYGEYLTSKFEEEAFLANIKRKYFEATNKIVDSRDAATEALNWLLSGPSKDRASERLRQQLIEENLLAKTLVDMEFKRKMDSRNLRKPETSRSETTKEIFEYFNWLKNRLPGLVKNKSRENTKVASNNFIRLLAVNACRLYSGNSKQTAAASKFSTIKNAAADPIYDLAQSAASSKPSKLELYGLPLALLTSKGLLGAGLGAGTNYLGEKLMPIAGETDEEKAKNRSRSILAGAGFGVGSGLLSSIGLYNQLLSQQKQANWSLNMCNELRKLGEDTRAASKPTSSEHSEKEKKQDRKNLGPLEHAYIADSIGGRAVQNAGRRLKTTHQDPDNPYQSAYDRLFTAMGGSNEGYGERISRGSARMSESPLWRTLALFDPTAYGNQEGVVGALSGFGGGEDKAEGAKQRAAEAYTEFLKKYQDKVDIGAKTTERETPFHVNLQGMLADTDSDIAGHAYMRNERPLHYWLNPLSKAGPLAELDDRGSRRIIAAIANPESTLGRFGMGVGGLATLGMLPIFMGGEEAQQKLRASAVKNRIYAPEAMPDEKEANAITLLAKQAASRCWKGYEPVPGKTPYSEDSCRPAGSKPKKKEKKAKSDWHEFADMTKDVGEIDPDFQESRRDMLEWIKETGVKKRKKAAGCDAKKCDSCGTASCECGSNLDVTQLAKLAVNSLKYPTSFYPWESDLLSDMEMQNYSNKSPSVWFKSDLSSRIVPARYFRKPRPPKPPSTPIPYVGKVPYEDFLASNDDAVREKNWQQIRNSSSTPIIADPSNVKNKDYSLARSFMTPRTVLSGKALKTNNPFAGK